MKDSEMIKYLKRQVELNAELISKNSRSIRKLDESLINTKKQIKELQEGY